MNSPLIDINTLKELNISQKLVILDATIDKVNEKIDNTNKALIPNSLFFDIQGTFSDHRSGLPNTMVSSQVFETNIRQLGINKDSVVIIYDRWGVYSSPRAWWMFRYMGHQKTYVLNGGLKAWQAAGLPVVSEHAQPQTQGNFSAILLPKWIVNKNEILTALEKHTASIIDARGAGRFNATIPEPRPGMRSGHIPTSINIPFEQVLNGYYIKNTQKLRQIFSSYLIKDRSIIFSCGSGITASILALAVSQLGINNISVYDGSWAEWGADPSLPIE